MDRYPKISIITPSYNQGQFIEETILSVINQNYPNLEYIIIDGGSTDNTVEIIKKYEKHLFFWISEPDRGQAHAINKGLEKATGEIFQWINSDDYLEKDALFKVAEAFSEPKIDLVAGKTVYFTNEVFEKPIQQAKLSSRGLMFWEKGVKFVQPGVWLKREKINNCGGIDEKFHYAFDWDLYIRYLNKSPQVKYIEDILVYFRLHENSKTVRYLNLFSNEEKKIIHKYSNEATAYELKKLSIKKIAIINWIPELKEIQASGNNVFNKTWQILRKHRIRYIPAWRLTLGAIKQIWINKI